MEKIDKAIEILQAFKEGKTIESKYVIGNLLGWQDVVSIDTLLSCFCNLDSIRIKKLPTYRPYANAEEFLKASKEHGPFLFIEKTDYTPKKYIQPSEIQDDFVEIGTAKIGYDNLLNHLTWGDNTKCGILETN